MVLIHLDRGISRKWRNRC